MRIMTRLALWFAEVSPPRYLLVGGEPTDIRLETSHRRLSHRLITHVFRIFLVEVLGYDAVSIVQTEDTSFNTTAVVNRIGGAIEGAKYVTMTSLLSQFLSFRPTSLIVL